MSNKFSYHYRVYYEDTDAGGVVYYANYLKFYERARTDFLRDHKIGQSELIEKEQLIFVVRKCAIEYKKSARLDDLIEVSVAIKEILPLKIIINQEISCIEKLLSIFEVEIVSVDSEKFKPKKIPQEIIKKLKII